MIKIGIDAHGAGGNSLGLGNETYFSNLIRALLSIDCENEYHVFTNYPEYFAALMRERPNLKLVTFGCRSQWIQRPISVPWYAFQNRLDVLHFPFVRPFITNSRVVITVHDTSYEIFPDLYRRSEALRMKALVPWSCRRADLIFTVSEYARMQIHECYQVPLEKIVVTYNSADHMLEIQKYANVPPGFELPNPYLLYIGLIQPRKNIIRMLQAFDLFKRRTGFPHHLVLAGKMGWHTSELQQKLTSLEHRTSVHFVGYVANPIPLAHLIAHAEIFVFPSIFESFAIPVLEAQTMGLPVLVAEGTCFPEIFGDSVHYCDPLSVESIAMEMETLIKDACLRSELSRKGAENVRRYSWKRSAQVALKAYERLSAGDTRRFSAAAV